MPAPAVALCSVLREYSCCHEADCKIAVKTLKEVLVLNVLAFRNHFLLLPPKSTVTAWLLGRVKPLTNYKLNLLL